MEQSVGLSYEREEGTIGGRDITSTRTVVDVHTFNDSGETTQGDGPGAWSRSGNYTDRASVVERRKDTSTGPLTINGLTGPSAETTSTTHDEASSDIASYTANANGRWPYG